ncbi:hypothetical protein [Butyrivibrio sp. WCE2006]|uniref:hypothetical protein n=1 Tax=Butyrivibrio sp. WCE2006 TaxID=1410611 RepID=UPI001A9A56E3
MGNHLGTIMFWLGYIEVMAFSSVLLHIVLFKDELEKDYPNIPYDQNEQWF